MTSLPPIKWRLMGTQITKGTDPTCDLPDGDWALDPVDTGSTIAIDRGGDYLPRLIRDGRVEIITIPADVHMSNMRRTGAKAN